MNRVFNFSAGPSMLPLPVLERAASELVCYGTSGMSVMEMSHRSPDYEAIIEKAQSDLRRLMNIPDNYKVLFLQGGGVYAVCCRAPQSDPPYRKSGLPCVGAVLR